MKKTLVPMLLSFVCLAAFSGLAFAGGDYNVRDYGAVGDGKTKDTVAIQTAIDACARAGGGTVRLPAGTYLSGSIFLKSRIDFYLEPGSILRGSPDREDYNRADVCPQNYASTLEVTSGGHLLLCIEQDHVTVRGPGRIDGNCHECTELVLGKDGKKLPGHAGLKWRPAQMLFFVESRDICISQLELVDAPYWSCFIHGCSHVRIAGVKITTRRGETHNGDGIDIDSSQYVTVSDCDIDTSDDALTLRAVGKRLKNPLPCRYVTVTNCRLSSGQACIRLGVGNGEIGDAVFSNLVFRNSNMGICLCPGWGQTGTNIENVRFDQIAFDCKRPFMMFFFCDTAAKIENISFSRIAGRCTGASVMLGTKKDCVRNIRFSDVELAFYGKKETVPLEFYRVDGLTLRNVRVAVPGRNETGTVKFGRIDDLQTDACRFTTERMTREEADERDVRPARAY